MGRVRYPPVMSVTPGCGRGRRVAPRGKVRREGKSPRLARSGVPRFRRFVPPSSREKERAEARDPRRGRSVVGRLLLAASRRVLSLLLTRGGRGREHPKTSLGKEIVAREKSLLYLATRKAKGKPAAPRRPSRSRRVVSWPVVVHARARPIFYILAIPVFRPFCRDFRSQTRIAPERTLHPPTDPPEFSP